MSLTNFVLLLSTCNEESNQVTAANLCVPGVKCMMARCVCATIRAMCPKRRECTWHLGKLAEKQVLRQVLATKL